MDDTPIFGRREDHPPAITRLSGLLTTETKAYIAALGAEIERLRETAHRLVSRSESVITTDAAGNRFQKVFEADLADLRNVLADEQKEVTPTKIDWSTEPNPHGYPSGDYKPPIACDAVGRPIKPR